MSITSAEREYDTELVRSMRDMADWVGKRSGKIATTLRQGADRIERLSNAASVKDPGEDKPHPEHPIADPLPTETQPLTNQPASTPAPA